MSVEVQPFVSVRLTGAAMTATIELHISGVEPADLELASAQVQSAGRSFATRLSDELAAERERRSATVARAVEAALAAVPAESRPQVAAALGVAPA